MYQVLKIKTMYDQFVEQDSLSESDIADLVRHPLITESKSDGKLWKFASLNEGHNGRKKEDLATLNEILQIDYDGESVDGVHGGCDFNAFASKFSEYKWVAHSTYSFKGDETRACFRVLLFTDKKLDCKTLTKDLQNELVGQLSFDGNKPDISTFQSNRFFYMPMKKAYNAPYFYRINAGALFTLPSDDHIQELADEEEDRRWRMAHPIKKQFSDSSGGSVRNNAKVLYYLKTSYPYDSGNGDSDLSFYRALCVAITAGDEQTLNLIIGKASSENWSDTEIGRKVAAAHRYCGK